DNQLQPTTAVTVRGDGLFDLGGSVQSIAALAMTGGRVALTGPSSQVTLGGNLTATSDPGRPAVIDGSGTLGLVGPNRTVRAAHAPGAVDLQVGSVITGISGEGMTKAGPGTRALTAANAYPGMTVVAAGKLLVNGPAGQVGAVSLAGGTLGGTGTVGALT